jgi:hypothetical protein
MSSKRSSQQKNKPKNLPQDFEDFQYLQIATFDETLRDGMTIARAFLLVHF